MLEGMVEKCLCADSPNQRFLFSYPQFSYLLKELLIIINSPAWELIRERMEDWLKMGETGVLGEESEKKN